MLLQIHHDREARRLGDAFFTSLADEPGILVLVPENLQSVGELALDSDVILLVARRPMTRGEVESALGWMVTAVGRGDMDEFRHRALASGLVQEALLDHCIESQQRMEDAEVEAFRADLHDTVLARRMLMDRARESMLPVMEEDALDHWREKEALMGRFHGRVRYDQVALPAATEGLDGWREKLLAVTSAQDFSRVARELASAIPTAILINGLQGHVALLPPEVSARVESGGVPGLVVARRETNEPLVAFWITEGVPDRQPTESEREKSRREVEEMRLQDAMETLLDEMSEQVKMEVLVPRTY
jgi:hypothetical protein